VSKCPYKDTEFGDARVSALIDTGAKHSCISERAYQSLVATGYEGLQFPVQPEISPLSIGLCISVKTGVLLTFKIDGDDFQQTFLVVPKLSREVILGADFLEENRIIIDFQEGCFWKRQKHRKRRYEYSSEKRNTRQNVEESETNGGHTDHLTDDPLLPSTVNTPVKGAQYAPLPWLQKLSLDKRPFKDIEFGEARTGISAVFDTGAQSSYISEEIYEFLKSKGYVSLEIPIRRIIIRSLLGHTHKVDTIALLEFKIDGYDYIQTFIVMPGLTQEVVLGVRFMAENRMIIDFPGKCFRLHGQAIKVQSPGEGNEFFLYLVSRPALGPTQPPVQWVPGVLSPGLKRGRGVTLTTHPI
jgi:predicted aspartyl protease